MSNLIVGVQFILLIILGMPVLYLVFLMIAASFHNRRKNSSKNNVGAAASAINFVILIPAHNEALTLPTTLQTIKALRYTGNKAEKLSPIVVVIADNCTDNTAQVAHGAGVIVFERYDKSLLGKGHALNWAIKLLLQQYDQSQFNALVIFDADTVPDKAFLKEAGQALLNGGQVLQGRYDLLNQGQSWRTRLLYSALVLYNHIRPLGRTVLGLSDGLRGNGMVFRRQVLEQMPWQAFSLVEDIEYTNRLALAGIKVTYVPLALIYSQAAHTGKQASTQRMRWEGGRIKQAKQDVPDLMRHFLTKGDWVAFDRAVDLLIPPLTILLFSLFALTFVNLLDWLWLGGLGLSLTLAACLFLLVAMVFFVVGGLWIGRCPLSAYTALLFAPFYMVWKLPLYFKMALRRTPQQWIRTSRSKIELNDLNRRG